jgi:hypothetical protein
VLITGADLSGATQVLFGSVPTTRFSVRASGTLVEAWSPSETVGTVPIVVITPNGASPLSSAAEFRFTPPSITKVSPDTGTTLGGTRVTISGAGLKGATEVRFGNKEALKFRVILRGSTITATTPPEPAGSVRIRVITPTGRTRSRATDVFTFG